MMFPALMGQLLGAGPDEPPLIQSDQLDFTNVNVTIMVMFVVFGAQAVFSFFRIYLFSTVTEKALRDLKQKTFDRLIMLPLDFYNRNKVGELTSRIATDVNLMQETLNTTIAEFFRQIVTIIVSLALIFYFSWELALWMLAVIPVLAIAAIIFGRYIRGLSRKAQDESAASNAVLSDVLNGIVNVKAFTNEKFESGRFSKYISSVLRLNVKSGTARGAFVSFIIFGMFGGIAFVIWKAKTMQDAGIISGPEFTAFIMYTLFLGASFGAVPDLYAKIQKAIGSTERVMDLLDEEPEQLKEGNEVEAIKGQVEFRKVSFSYPQRKSVQVLDEISFTCQPGETIALVGSSGAGKSTISSLLMKFYKVDQGEILYDGQNIDDLDNHGLRKHIAVVPQEVMLFAGSISENVKYGRPDASEEEVMEAIKQANAYDFIMGFPDKMETLVGDRGIQLSGGQKQRIAIARALLKNPEILILDEATSALDAESEKLVQDALEHLMKGRTSFVIAHRLSTIRNADSILVLEKGKIVEQGTHDELIANSEGAYFKLNSIQLN